MRIYAQLVQNILRNIFIFSQSVQKSTSNLQNYLAGQTQANSELHGVSQHQIQELNSNNNNMISPQLQHKDSQHKDIQQTDNELNNMNIFREQQPLQKMLNLNTQDWFDQAVGLQDFEDEEKFQEFLEQ